MCSKEDWTSHADAKVLPASADTDNPEFVPVEDTEFANQFDCPDCGESHRGYPEECGACGVSYKWSQ